jgi:hypothetical protein
MILSCLPLYLILRYIFRNSRVSQAEAERSKPLRFLGMDVWPKRNVDDIKMPIYVLIAFVTFAIASLFLDFQRNS